MLRACHPERGDLYPLPQTFLMSVHSPEGHTGSRGSSHSEEGSPAFPLREQAQAPLIPECKFICFHRFSCGCFGGSFSSFLW